MNLHLVEDNLASSLPVDQSPASMVGYYVGLCQGFTCVLDMSQILLREIYFRRKAVLFYPKGFTHESDT